MFNLLKIRYLKLREIFYFNKMLIFKNDIKIFPCVHKVADTIQIRIFLNYLQSD